MSEAALPQQERMLSADALMLPETIITSVLVRPTKRPVALSCNVKLAEVFICSLIFHLSSAQTQVWGRISSERRPCHHILSPQPTLLAVRLHELLMVIAGKAQLSLITLTVAALLWSSWGLVNLGFFCSQVKMSKIKWERKPGKSKTVLPKKE